MPDSFTERDVAAFDAAWRSRWPEVYPVGHQLRCAARSTWMRFHSVPIRKRYTDAEFGDIARRHRVLISQLCALTGTCTDELVLVTASWSGSAQPVDRVPDLIAAVPTAVYWTSVPSDVSIPDEPTWTHLYLTGITLNSDEYRELLLLIADDATADQIICPPNAAWLYHPYDGGADVIAPDTDTRDTLRAEYVEWLPDR